MTAVEDALLRKMRFESIQLDFHWEKTGTIVCVDALDSLIQKGYASKMSFSYEATALGYRVACKREDEEQALKKSLDIS